MANDPTAWLWSRGGRASVRLGTWQSLKQSLARKSAAETAAQRKTVQMRWTFSNAPLSLSGFRNNGPRQARRSRLRHRVWPTHNSALAADPRKTPYPLQRNLIAVQRFHAVCFANFFSSGQSRRIRKKTAEALLEIFCHIFVNILRPCE